MVTMVFIVHFSSCYVTYLLLSTFAVQHPSKRLQILSYQCERSLAIYLFLELYRHALLRSTLYLVTRFPYFSHSILAFSSSLELFNGASILYGINCSVTVKRWILGPSLYTNTVIPKKSTFQAKNMKLECT